MKQSLEEIIIAFTIESQLFSMSQNYLSIAEKDGEKDFEKFLIKYINQKKKNISELLDIIQVVKDQINEYNDDERAVEIGVNIGIGDSYENIQYLIKSEKNLANINYPEVANITSDEGLIEISPKILDYSEQSKKILKEMKKLIS